MKKLSFIHISDIHFKNSYKGEFSERLTALTNNSLTDQLIIGLRRIQSEQSDIDFVMISGDLTQSVSVTEYANLKSILEKELNGLPIFVTFGNHDNENFYKGFLGTENTSEAYYYATDFDGLRIIGLDSRGGNYESGLLGKEQLDWLKDELTHSSERGSVLFMHHTPHISGEIPYLNYQMENPEALFEIIKDADIKAIFTGHTHKKFVSMFGTIPCYTVDSITFGINTFEERMEIDNITGYNLCVLEEDGNLDVTHVPIIPKQKQKAVIYYNEMV